MSVFCLDWAHLPTARWIKIHGQIHDNEVLLCNLSPSRNNCWGISKLKQYWVYRRRFFVSRQLPSEGLSLAYPTSVEKLKDFSSSQPSSQLKPYFLDFSSFTIITSKSRKMTSLSYFSFQGSPKLSWKKRPYFWSRLMKKLWNNFSNFPEVPDIDILRWDRQDMQMYVTKFLSCVVLFEFNEIINAVKINALSCCQSHGFLTKCSCYSF